MNLVAGAIASLATSLVVATSIVQPPPDGGDPPPGGNPPASRGDYGMWTGTTVEYLGKTVNHADLDNWIAYCTIRNRPGPTCNISRTAQFTSTVTATFGASAEAISASVGISETEMVGVTAACTSPPMKTDETFWAFPTQTRYYYRVHTNTPDRTDEYHYEPAVNSISPTAYTAVYDGGVSCEIR